MIEDLQVCADFMGTVAKRQMKNGTAEQSEEGGVVSDGVPCAVLGFSRTLTPREGIILERAFGKMDSRKKGTVSFQQFSQACRLDMELCCTLSKSILSPNGEGFLNSKDLAQIWQTMGCELDVECTLQELWRVWKPCIGIVDQEKLMGSPQHVPLRRGVMSLEGGAFIGPVVISNRSKRREVTL